MKIPALFLTLIISSPLFAAEGTAASHEHEHDGHSSGAVSAQATLNNGKKWKSDATLKKNMIAMHKEFNSLHSKFESKKATQEDFKSMQTTTQKSLDDIFKNCKLEPKADATLHEVLAQLMAAKEKLEKDSSRLDGLKQMQTGFDMFHQYFQ